MIYRAEPKMLMIFNDEIGITAILTGSELINLKNYLENNKLTEFIKRLFDLKLLPVNLDIERKKLLDKISETEKVTVPLRSLSSPESIHIDITTNCQLNCPQCYKGKSTNKEMSYEEFTYIIDQAKNMDVFQIAIGGGEPLLIKELDKYIKYVREKGMACTITTSGIGLNQDTLRNLQESGINHIQVSLNGSKAEIHNLSREGFEEGINALKLLSKNNIPFGINWVARLDNVYDLENVIKLANNFKASNINILRYKPSPAEDYHKIALTNVAYLYLKNIIKEICGIRVTVDSAFSNLLCDLYDNRIDKLNSGCAAGRSLLYIDAYGNLKPCSHMKIASVNKNIRDYWDNSKDLLVLRSVEELINGKCQDCRNLNNCRGCRAICEKVYNNVNAGDETCYAYIKRS